MKICSDCNNGKEAEYLKAEWYYTRKLQEAKTETEAEAYALFWHCTLEQINYKYKQHERSLSYGKGAGKTNSSKNL